MSLLLRQFVQQRVASGEVTTNDVAVGLTGYVGDAAQVQTIANVWKQQQITKRNQRCALATGSHITLPDIVDHRYAGAGSQRSAVT